MNMVICLFVCMAFCLFVCVDFWLHIGLCSWTIICFIHTTRHGLVRTPRRA